MGGEGEQKDSEEEVFFFFIIFLKIQLCSVVYLSSIRPSMDESTLTGKGRLWAPRFSSLLLQISCFYFIRPEIEGTIMERVTTASCENMMLYSIQCIVVDILAMVMIAGNQFILFPIFFLSLLYYPVLPCTNRFITKTA